MPKPGHTTAAGLGHGKVPAKFRTFYVPRNKPADYAITGITRDATGAVLGGCAVDVFETTSGRRLVGSTTSDPVTGKYSVPVNGPHTGMTFEAVAYRPGAPDRAGASLNSLPGVEL